jgi:hypothetical protein
MLYWRVFGSGLCRCIAAASMDLPALYLKILFPVMIQIGELWRSGTLGYPFELFTMSRAAWIIGCRPVGLGGHQWRRDPFEDRIEPMLDWKPRLYTALQTYNMGDKP